MIPTNAPLDPVPLPLVPYAAWADGSSFFGLLRVFQLKLLSPRSCMSDFLDAVDRGDSAFWRFWRRLRVVRLTSLAVCAATASNSTPKRRTSCGARRLVEYLACRLIPSTSLASRFQPCRRLGSSQPRCAHRLWSRDYLTCSLCGLAVFRHPASTSATAPLCQWRLFSVFGGGLGSLEAWLLQLCHSWAIPAFRQRLYSLASISIECGRSSDKRLHQYHRISDALAVLHFIHYSDSRYCLSAIWYSSSGYQYQYRLMEDYPTCTQDSVSICPNDFDPARICGPGLYSTPAGIPNFW
jgi:hypothetical protein